MMHIVDQIFDVHGWTVVLLVVFYIVPILRFLTLPWERGGHFFRCANRFLGLWEHFVWPLRDTVGIIYVAGGSIWFFWRGIETGEWEFFILCSILTALLLLGLAMRRWRDDALLSFLSFIADNPTIHPKECFDHLICSFGAIRYILPTKPFVLIDPSALDFRRGRSSKGIGIIAIAIGVWSTIWIARLIIIAKKRCGIEFMQRVASAFAIIWGARIAELSRAAVTVDGKEHLSEMKDIQIYLFTHMSFLDFALAPLVLAGRPKAHSKIVLSNCPSFLLAKDHFRDNFLFYRILGIGKAAEALGMIFVERKGKGSSERARSVANLAANMLISEHSPLIIFPQGARAATHPGLRGERIDSAYYAVGSHERMKADGKHLKKGASLIAATATAKLARSGSREIISILPIAFSGTGMACPRGSMRITPNVHIRLLIGKPISIDPSLHHEIINNDDKVFEFASELHVKIELALKGTGKIHAELERRFFEDMRGILDPMKVEEIAIAMKSWRGGDYLIHAILDTIYSCKPDSWRPFVGELTHLLLNFASREDFLALKGRIANAVP